MVRISNQGKMDMSLEAVLSSSLKMERLYKVDSIGNKRVWYVELGDSGYTTHSGMVGGKIVSRFYPVEAVTTGEKQFREQKPRIQFKAQSAWNEKRQKGGMVTEAELLAGDSDLYPISPIQAKHYEAGDGSVLAGDNTVSWYAQYKYDGVRCIASLVPSATTETKWAVDLNSRGRQPWPFLDHIRAEVMRLLIRLPPGFHLDGELYVHGLVCGDVTSLVRGEDGKPHPDHHRVRYVVYDLIYPTRGMEGSILFQDRYRILTALFQSGDSTAAAVELAPLVGMVKSDEELAALLVQAEDQGYEGLVIRHPYMLYPRKIAYRSKHLLKCKSFLDMEVRITGCQRETDGHDGCIKFQVETLESDKKISFMVSAHGTLDHRRAMWLNHITNKEDYIGRLYTIKYKSISKYGVPITASGIGFRDEADLS